MYRNYPFNKVVTNDAAGEWSDFWVSTDNGYQTYGNLCSSVTEVLGITKE